MSGLPCGPSVPGLIWPGRTAPIVEREQEQVVAAMRDVALVRIRHGRIVEVDGEQRSGRDTPLLHDHLVTVLGTDSPLRSIAAFAAGRCTTGDADADESITAALRSLVDEVDTSKRLGKSAKAYVEALMSLALLGDVESAATALADRFTDGALPSVADHLAAGYLAQLGRPDGWPALVGDLADADSSLVRQMAVDQLLAFVPLDGRTVGDSTVDVRAALRRALRDDDPDVGIEAIGVILDAGLPDADALLDEATQRTSPKQVRKAAAEAKSHR